MTTVSEVASSDLAARIKGRSVGYTGSLATMTRDEFEEIVTRFGGRFSNTIQVGRGLGFLVVGERTWPITRDGVLNQQLREARILAMREGSRITVLSERQFLDALGLLDRADQLRQLYSTATLIDLLNVPREQIAAWVKANLIRPVRTEHGVWYFDFAQVSAAKTLCDLTRNGVKPARIQRSLDQLRKWMPQATEPLRQLAAISSNDQVLVRLNEGSLAEPNGQFRIDFDDGGDDSAQNAPPMRLVCGPTTAAQWFEQGLEQEQANYHAEAAASYRQALLMGGPDADVAFCLANVLRELGKQREAIERYLQAVEIKPEFVEAWNNLGLALVEIDRREEACLAFRKALEYDATHARTLYNLADTLDELRRSNEAEQYWKAYTDQDKSISEWACYARGQLGRFPDEIS